jgi:hypothetical protein
MNRHDDLLISIAEVSQMGNNECGMKDFQTQREVNGKFVCTGSMFCDSYHGRYSYNMKTVNVPEGNRIFLACISLNMLSPVGGPFNEDDAVYADIFAIDGDDKGLYYLNDGNTDKVFNHPREWFTVGYSPDWLHDRLVGEGGAWGYLWGSLPYQSASKNPKTVRISTWLGEIQKNIIFRLSVNGDDWAGASYFVMQLS